MKSQITLIDVMRAAKIINNYVCRTPIIEDRSLAGPGNTALLKLETMQPTGSFKVRGAANKILSLSPHQRAKGVTTFSTGNHGLAVSYIAGQLGIKATVCMSTHVPEVKRTAITRYGGKIVQIGQGQDDAELHCAELSQKLGMQIIKPFDDLSVIAGQGTIGLEIMLDYPDLNTILIPLSGGGLISGVALAIKSIKPDVRVFGVSMERSAAMYQSLQIGAPVQIPEEPTLADSLLGGIGLNNSFTFRMVNDFVDDVVLVSEREIANAIAYLVREHRIIAEGGGCVGVAALLSGKIRSNGITATVVSGKNISADWLRDILHEKIPTEP